MGGLISLRGHSPINPVQFESCIPESARTCIIIANSFDLLLSWFTCTHVYFDVSWGFGFFLVFPGNLFDGFADVLRQRALSGDMCVVVCWSCA